MAGTVTEPCNRMLLQWTTGFCRLLGMDWRLCISGLIDSGLTSDQIAAAIGVTPNAVREITAGRTKSPRANAAMRLMDLCRVQGVTPTPASTDPDEADPDATRIVPVESA